MSATKLYVYIAESASIYPAANARIMAHLWNGGTTCDVEMDKEAKYGYLWYSCELNGNTKAIIVRQNPEYGSSTSIDWDNLWARTLDINDLSTSEDNYGELWYNTNSKEYGVWTGTSVRPGTGWTGLACRNSIDLWSISTNNMESTDNNCFTRTFTKADIDAANLKAGDKFYFKFKHIENIIFDESCNHKNTWTEIHPTEDTQINFSEIIDNTYQASGESNKTWYVLVPSYSYEKIVFTANYVKDGSSYKWKVSADAYITKTITAANEYATLGCSVPLEIVEANGVTAHPLTANASTGKITKGDAITEIPANEGALLENATGENQTIRAKVLADDPSVKPSNQLVAFTGSGNLTQPAPAENKTYYILTKKNDNVGFYKVNTTSGNSMGANTAYLEVDGIITSARDFFVLEGETTGIANLNVNDNVNFNADAPMYNLAGQRVGKNYKGVVIVNGKKMLNK